MCIHVLGVGGEHTLGNIPTYLGRGKRNSVVYFLEPCWDLLHFLKKYWKQWLGFYLGELWVS